MRPVLIIEDDTIVRQSMAMTLAEEGFPVWQAANGRDALTLLGASSQLPGLILLDIHMPVMGASQFIRELRDDPKLQQIPVVVMTASTTDEIPPSLSDLTSLLKPMTADDLVAIATTFCAAV